jgi:hypothetical protein
MPGPRFPEDGVSMMVNAKCHGAIDLERSENEVALIGF